MFNFDDVKDAFEKRDRDYILRVANDLYTLTCMKASYLEQELKETEGICDELHKVISRIVLENSDSDAFDEDVKTKWNKAHGKNYFVRKECEVKHHD